MRKIIQFSMILLTFCGLQNFCFGQSQEINNVQIGINYPAHGINMKANFPSYTGSFVRGYNISNEDNTISFLSLGVAGNSQNGVSSNLYGFIGRSIDDKKPFMTFKENGSIGIGTTSPLYELDVVGGVRANAIIASKNHPNIGGSISIVNDAKSDLRQAYKWMISNMSGSYGNSLQFWAYDKKGCEDGGMCENKLTLMDNGNVGIGTGAPTYKLDVCGTIRAKEIKVDLQGGCDFVFEDNYELRSLAEVDAFIKKNKHLPEIASEKEMIKNGLEMKEFQMKLLQKVEEITLYLIKLNIENQELRNEIEALKKN